MIPDAAVLIVAGLQVPAIAGLLVELTGNEGAVLFWHSPNAVKIGMIWVAIVISMVVAEAHCPAAGVKV